MTKEGRERPELSSQRPDIDGGALAFYYGFNVETSGDHPVWHD